MHVKKSSKLPVMNFIHILFFIFLTIFSVKETKAGPKNNQQHFMVQLEGGPVWQSRNDVQIPNNQDATRFSLVDLAGKGPLPAFRFYFTWSINSRHDIRLLLAPLNYTKTGTFTSPVSFVGQNYNPGQDVDATYKFNSFRLTYRYNFHRGEKWHWGIGFTAKIRDARIKLEQNTVSSEKTDLGFVPLLHLRGKYFPGEQTWFLLDIDALAGGPGRAEDATIQVGYDFSDNFSISIGYRTVEGGADVEEVYNFAWLHYIVSSIHFSF